MGNIVTHKCIILYILMEEPRDNRPSLPSPFYVGEISLENLHLGGWMMARAMLQLLIY